MDLLRWMQQWDMVPEKGEVVLCAVSGGRDSMCLLQFVSGWAAENQRTVTAAHFNHQLRKTAGRDEVFVRDWCAANSIPFVSGCGDVRAAAEQEGLTIEEAARNLRYSFFISSVKRTLSLSPRFTCCFFILSTLKSDSEIISQKKLKLRIKNSTIEIDVFIKAYENITDYRNIDIKTLE